LVFLCGRFFASDFYDFDFGNFLRGLAPLVGEPALTSGAVAGVETLVAVLVGQPLIGAALVVVFTVAVMDRDAVSEGTATQMQYLQY
jgi:hypothetical protein